MTRKSNVFYAVLIALASVVTGMVLASRLDLTPSSLARTLNVPAANSSPITGPIDATTFRTIAHEAGPSVVSIRVQGRRPVQAGLEDFFGIPIQPGQSPRGGRRMPQPDDQDREQLVQGAGSGFIIDKTGYILTNNHVVEDADTIEVQLSSMDEFSWLPAKLVGRDTLTDTALIQLTRLPDRGITEAKFGDSSQIQPGDWVMAIGNPFQLSNTVTVGVVSAVGRPYQAASGRWEDMIQTDAAINRGNSGGPLLNIRGEVVGINTMIITDQGSGNVGVGFAVPINRVRDLLPSLREGKVTRGRIGVSVLRTPMSKEDAEDLGLPRPMGAVVSGFSASSSAKAAGVKLNDVIVEFNGKPVKDNNDLVDIVTATTPGSTVPVKLIRDKKTITLNVKVDELDLAAESSNIARAEPRSAPREAPKATGGFGMTIQELGPRERQQLQVPAGRGGAVVVDVQPFGAAGQSGIGAGDVILSVQGVDVKNADAVSAALDAVPSGRSARIVVWRQGEEVLVPVRKR